MATINSTMEQARLAPDETAPTDEQAAAIEARLAEDADRVRQGWRSDTNQPDVEIRVSRRQAEAQTVIEARFRPQTGEPEQRYRSVVDDLDLYQGVNGDGILNEHIRMTVDRLCAERRQAAEVGWRRTQAFGVERYGTSPFANLTVTMANATTAFTANTAATTTNLTYQWRDYANFYFNVPITFSNLSVQNVPLTPAQVEANRVAAAERAAAEKIAEELLLDVIGRHRYRIWRKQGTVHVSSRKFKGLRYEIKAGEMIKLHQRTGRTWRVRRDKLCIHPLDKHPRGDEVATLFVLARFDEDELWRTANHHHKDQEPPLELAA